MAKNEKLTVITTTDGYSSHTSAKQITTYSKSLQVKPRSVLHGNSLVSLIAGIVLFLVVVSLLRVSYVDGQLVLNIPTFRSFMEMLSNIDSFQIPFLSLSVTDLGDWGIFQSIAYILTFFTKLADCAIFLLNGILSVLTFIVEVVQWIFI